MNLLARRGATPFWMPMANELGGFSFRCDLGDSIAREVCFTGRYEPQETALIQHLLGAEMTFIDIGANWGYYTLLATHIVGPNGRVICLEPDPRQYRNLRDNLARNRLGHVTALQLAAADKPGSLSLAGYSEENGNYGLSRLVTEPSAGSAMFEVETGTIDNVLDEHDVEQVDLLKMDIEGAEDLALQGMIEGLSTHKYRRILLELHPALLAERGRTTVEIERMLTDAGYTGWHLDFSSAANRRAAYTRRVNVREFLRPISESNARDDWPHVLWLAPGVNLPA